MSDDWDLQTSVVGWLMCPWWDTHIQTQREREREREREWWPVSISREQTCFCRAAIATNRALVYTSPWLSSHGANRINILLLRSVHIISLISSHLIWPHLNRLHFVLSSLWLIDRSHGKQRRFTVQSPVCVVATNHSALRTKWGRLRWGQMRWDEMSDMTWTLL